MKDQFIIRDADQNDYEQIGRVLVSSYTLLNDFPKPQEQPNYYDKLQHIYKLLTDDSIELFVAIINDQKVAGTVLFFGDMAYYGSKGTATKAKNTAGFRFLGVDPDAQGLGIGKALSLHCIDRAKELKCKQVIIHSTEAMKTARSMYLKIGFEKAPYLDFDWDGYGVYGFKLDL